MVPDKEVGLHSGLTDFLAAYPETPVPVPTPPTSPRARFLQQVAPDKKFVCALRCGEGFSSNSKSCKQHHKACWFARSTPLTPVRERNLRNLNAPWATGFVAEARDFNDRPFAILMGDQVHLDLLSGQVFQPEDRWWNGMMDLKWREATEEELAKLS